MYFEPNQHQAKTSQFEQQSLMKSTTAVSMRSYSVVFYLTGIQWLMSGLVLVQCNVGAMNAVLPKGRMAVKMPTVQARAAPVAAQFQLPKLGGGPSQWAGEALAGLKANLGNKLGAITGIQPAVAPHPKQAAANPYGRRDFLADHGHRLTKAQRDEYDEWGGCEMLQFDDQVCGTCCEYYDSGALRGDQGVCRCVFKVVAAELRGVLDIKVQESDEDKHRCDKLKFGSSDCQQCCLDRLLKPFEGLFGSQCICGSRQTNFWAAAGIKL